MKKNKALKFPWTKTIRRETGLIENICEHGVGHPAIGSVQWMELNGAEAMGIHGCDGCCNTPEWKLADAQEGLRIANILLFEEIKINTPLRKEIELLKKEILYHKKVNNEMSDALSEMSKKRKKKK